MENEELVLTLRTNDATKQQPFLPTETCIQTMQFTHPYPPFPHHYPTAIPSLSLYPSTPHPEDHTRPPLTPSIIHQRIPQQKSSPTSTFPFFSSATFLTRSMPQTESLPAAFANTLSPVFNNLLLSFPSCFLARVKLNDALFLTVSNLISSHSCRQSFHPCIFLSRTLCPPSKVE